jgi:nucleotide-binding universal stress UspA family protein
VYEQIIVGYDGGDEAADALAFGRLVAQGAGGTLILARVFPFTPFVAEATGARTPPDVALLEIEMDRIADETREVAEANGAEISAVPSNSAVRGLQEIAEERHANLLVVGSTQRAGLGTVLLGSVGQRLLHNAPCAVAVVPRGYRDRALGEPRVIAAAFNGSAESSQALDAAAKLAKATQATIRVLAVLPAEGMSAETLEDALEQARDGLPVELRASTQMLCGPAATVLAREAEKGVDSLFVGSRGYGPVRRAILGSVSSQLMSSAPCPVVITPRGNVAHGELVATHGEIADES